MEQLEAKLEAKLMITQVQLNLNFLAAFMDAVKSNPEQKIGDFFKKWHEDIEYHEEKNYHLFNQGVILTSLYAFIIYPKEVFFESIPKDVSFESLDKNKWGEIKIDKCPDKHKNLKSIITRIRNSLSHNWFSIKQNSEQNFNFIFEDRPYKNAPIDFKISLDTGSLQKFVESFYDAYVSGKYE